MKTEIERGEETLQGRPEADTLGGPSALVQRQVWEGVGFRRGCVLSPPGKTLLAQVPSHHPLCLLAISGERLISPLLGSVQASIEGKPALALLLTCSSTTAMLPRSGVVSAIFLFLPLDI